jgi:diguanylate cyclase (GGDEF)-like protein/PAS domain S-box-containing protein
MRLFLAPGAGNAAAIRAVTTAAGYDCPDLSAGEPLPAGAVVVLPAGPPGARARCGALHASLSAGTLFLAVEADANDVEALLDAGASDVLCGPLDAAVLTVRLSVLRHRHDAEAALHASARRQAEDERDRLFLLSIDMLAVVDASARFVRVNPAWTETTGYEADELTGQRAFDYLHEDDFATVQSALEQLRLTQPLRGERLRFRCKNGAYRWFSWAVTPPQPGSDDTYCVVRDVTALVAGDDERDFVTEALRSNAAALEEQAAVLDQLRAEAEYAANHDMLTGALNRRAWFAAAVSERSWNLGVFDLDHFKNVNDTWGHPAGDAVLAEFARRLSAAAGSDALVGRLGGEEFGVLFRGPFHAARAACEAALDEVAGTPFLLPGGQAITVTVSCGLAPWQPGTHSREESLSLTYDAADRALYRAKASGRARIEAAAPRAA